MKKLIIALLLPTVLFAQNSSNLIPKNKQSVKNNKSSIKVFKNLTETISFVNKCIVKITTKSGTGTGFFISDDGYVITNYHVVVEDYKKGIKEIEVNIAGPNLTLSSGSIKGSFFGSLGVIVDIDIVHDLALIKLQQNPFLGKIPTLAKIDGKIYEYLYGLPTTSVKPLQDGARIGVSGYPLNQPVLITNSGSIASIWGEYNYDNNPAKVSIDNDAFYSDMQVNPGNSGGPVYLVETGEVIGVAVAFLDVSTTRGSVNFDPAVVAKINNIYRTTTNQETKDIIELLATMAPVSSYNSGLSIIIPFKYVDALLKKNSIKRHK